MENSMQTYGKLSWPTITRSTTTLETLCESNTVTGHHADVL